MSPRAPLLFFSPVTEEKKNETNKQTGIVNKKQKLTDAFFSLLLMLLPPFLFAATQYGSSMHLNLPGSSLYSLWFACRLRKVVEAPKNFCSVGRSTSLEAMRGEEKAQGRR